MRFAHYSYKAPNGYMIVTPLGKLISEEEYLDAYATVLDWPCAWEDQTKFPTRPDTKTMLDMYDELEKNSSISSLVSVDGIAFVFLLSYLVQQATSVGPELAHAMGRSLIRFTNYSGLASAYLEISAEDGDPDDAYYVCQHYRNKGSAEKYLRYAKIAAEKGRGRLNTVKYHYAYLKALYETDKVNRAFSIVSELIDDLNSGGNDLFLPLSLLLRILAETKVDYEPDYKILERWVLRSNFHPIEKANLSYWLGKCRLSGINGKRDAGRAETYFRIAMDAHPSMTEKAGLALAKMYYDGDTYDGVVDCEEALAIGEAVEQRVGKNEEFVDAIRSKLRDERLKTFISLLTQNEVTFKNAHEVLHCLARHLEKEEFDFLMECFIRRGYDEERYKGIFEKLAYPPTAEDIFQACKREGIDKDEPYGC